MKNCHMYGIFNFNWPSMQLWQCPIYTTVGWSIILVFLGLKLYLFLIMPTCLPAVLVSHCGRETTITIKHLNLIHNWSDKAFKVNVLNRALTCLCKESILKYVARIVLLVKYYLSSWAKSLDKWKIT